MMRLFHDQDAACVVEMLLEMLPAVMFLVTRLEYVLLQSVCDLHLREYKSRCFQTSAVSLGVWCFSRNKFGGCRISGKHMEGTVPGHPLDTITHLRDLCPNFPMSIWDCKSNLPSVLKRGSG